MSIFSKKRVYLDWASAAPVHPEAAQACTDALAAGGNPSSPHEEGRIAKELLENARTTIARLAGVKARAVVFTSGATEANALAIQGRVRKCLEEGMKYEQMHILYLPTMHTSVLNTLTELQARGVRTETLPLIAESLHIDIPAAARLILPETILICVDAVCGETGSRVNTLQMRRAIDASISPARAVLHIDASQLPLVELIDHTRLGAHMMVLDAQKVGGVRGIGALLIPDKKIILPITHGGGQEDGLRPGTEPVALATAFAKALSICADEHDSFAASALALRKELIDGLSKEIPEFVINESKHNAPHILNVSFPGLDTDYLVALLDKEGFAVSTRSACETDSVSGSKAVLMLTGDTVRAASTLRTSWGPQTSPKELKRILPALRTAVNFLRKGTLLY